MNARSVKEFAEKLRRLPRDLSKRVAKEAAPAITALALQTFNVSEDAFGEPWQKGRDGPVTLRRTGELASAVEYIAIGDKLRISLGVPYAKYQIGKRPVFPRAGAELPEEYTDALKHAVNEAARDALR